jgi:acyl carrier protein
MSSGTDTVGPVRRFVVENFLFGRETGFGDEESFLESGIVDSTGVLQLVAFLESTYGIQVRDDELVPDNLDSVARISSYLDRKLSG